MQELMRVKEVRNKRLRSLLIAVAVKLESLLPNFLSGAQTLKPTLTPIGLRIDTTFQIKESGPTVFRFTYHLDQRIFEGWCLAHKWLIDGGPFTCTNMGIEFVVPFGASKWHQSGTYLTDGNDKDSSQVWLKLLDHDVTFVVHREITELREWEVYLEA